VRPPTRLLASGRVAALHTVPVQGQALRRLGLDGRRRAAVCQAAPFAVLAKAAPAARLRAGRLRALRRGAGGVPAGVRAPCAERGAAALVDGAQPAPRRAQQERGGGGGGLAVVVAGRWRCRSRQWVPGRCAAAPDRSLEQPCSVLRSSCHRTACRCMLAPRVDLRGTS